ncbi:hypothetical protein [Actinoplanes sp. DH11]|uniref:hypothetical protein n=1 Tax=Actinoplanes sp. DH11 TaxID=2857011 RepID=UPI001E49A1C9|nr:hypothetical protein [Actinoplanes sp. DH11]
MADELVRLAEIRAARALLDEQELDLIDRARHAGATWARIAAAVGLGSRQAAEQRRQRLAAAAQARCRDVDLEQGPGVAAARTAMTGLHNWMTLDRHWDSRFTRAALVRATVAVALRAAPGALYALGRHVLADLTAVAPRHLPAPVRQEAAALRAALSTRD